MRPVADVFPQDREDFLILPGELPNERRPNFRNNLVADGNGVVAEDQIERGLWGSTELEGRDPDTRVENDDHALRFLPGDSSERISSTNFSTSSSV